MRRFLLFFVVMLSGIGMIFAQSGQKLSYQAVIRNSANQLVTNTQLEVTIGIANSEDGAAVYTEHHTVTTNANGLISLMIGMGDNRTGDWGQIEWEHAYVTTNTVVDGVPVRHKVELTAVAHAFYADNVDEESITEVLSDHGIVDGAEPNVQGDWNQENTGADDYIKNKPNFSNVAISGNYNDLTNKPDLNQYATNVHLNDTLGHYLMREVQILSISNDTIYLTGGSFVKLPAGFSGDYNDLINKPLKSALCDSVQECVTGWISDSTRMVFDTLHTKYATTNALRDSLTHYVGIEKLNDTLGHYLQADALCDSIVKCDVIVNLQTADSLLGARIAGDSIALSGKIHSDSAYLKGLIDANTATITNNTTNITNNTTNISNITNNITNLQVADSVLSARFTKDSIALSKRLDTMFTHICDSLEQCEVITNLQNADAALSARITADSILSYKADSILAARITRDSILSYKADSLLSARITADSSNLANNYYNKTNINDTVTYILSQITNTSGDLNDNYYTKAEINDTLSHYTTTDNIDSLLRGYATNDTLKNYLTISGLCDSIKNCEVITDLQNADSLLGVRITRDSVLSYKADSALAVRMINDSVLFYKTDSVLLVHILNDSVLSHQADSILLARILNDSANLANNYYTTAKINDTLSHYTTTDHIDSLLRGYATNDTLKNYLTIDGLCDSIKQCEVIQNMHDSIRANAANIQTNAANIQTNATNIANVRTDITNLQNADAALSARITADSILSYKADSLLSARITADSSNLANNYYNKTNINDTIAYILSQITNATGDLNDNYYTKAEINDTLKNYLTISGLCDSIKNCEVITDLQNADSLLGVRITRDSVLSYKADSALAVRMINDSVLFYKTDSVLLVHILNDSVLSHQADSILLARILNDSANLANNYYTTAKINDTLSHYTTTDNIDSLLRGYATNDTLKNYLTIDGLCDSIKQCEVIQNMHDSIRANAADIQTNATNIANIRTDITNLQNADAALSSRITADSIRSYKADSVLSARITADSILSYKSDSILSARITADSTNLANNYYNKIKINDTVAYILSQITSASVDLNDNYYTKPEINDTLSHYTTTDQIDSLLRDYAKSDTLKNYLTIDGLCDSIKKCDVIANLQDADSVLAARITRDSILSYKADSVLAVRITADSILSYKSDSVLSARIIADSILFYKADSVLLAHILTDSVLSYRADSALLARILKDSVVSYRTDSVLLAHILNDSALSYKADSILLALILKDSANLANNYYTKAKINDTLSHYTTTDHIDSLLRGYATNDTLKNYLTIDGLCDSIKQCEVIQNMHDSIRANAADIQTNATNIANIRTDITNLQNADAALSSRITADSIRSYKADSVLSARITADSILSYKSDSILSARITADSTNLANNYYNKIKINDTVAYILSQITSASVDLNDNYYTKPEINDTLSHYTTTDQIDSLLRDYAKSDTLKNYLTIDGLCDSIKKCDVIANLQDADSVLAARITRDSILSYKADSVLAVRITADSILSYKSDSVLSARIIADSILFYKADSVLLSHILTDSILSYRADSALLARILKDSVVSYRTDSVLLARILNDSALSYKSDSVLLALILKDSANLANNYYTTAKINDTLSHYTTTDNIDSLLRGYATNDTLKNYLTISGLCDSLEQCEVITNLQNADAALSARITADSILSYKADSLLSARITADSSNLANNYYNKTNINDTVTYILSQITNTSGDLNDNYYTKAEINDTLSHYTTTDNIDSLLRGYATNDTLKNYLTISGLCDSIKNCEVITDLQKADSLLGVRITRDSVLFYRADSILAARITADSILSYKADSILAARLTADSATITNNTTKIENNTTNISNITNNVNNLQIADSVLNARFTRDSIVLSKRLDTIFTHICDSIEQCDVISNLQKADSLLGVRITRDSVLSYKADSVLSARLIDTASKIREDFPRVSDKTVTLKQGNDTIGRFTLNQESDYTLTIPTPPDAQVQSDWNQTTTTEKDYIKHKPNIRDSVNRVVLDSLFAANSAMNKAIDTIAGHISQKIVSDSTRMVFDTLHTYYATKDTLKNYLTITGLCDSVMKCDGIKALQTADNNLSSRITADSLALVQTIRNDSTDLAKHISDSTRMVFDTLHTYYATKDTLKNYLTITGLCDSVMKCDGIKALQTADNNLSSRITADSLALVQTIRNDSTDLAKHISDSTRMVFDTLHTYYATKDTLKNYLTITGLCDSVMKCDGIKALQTADNNLSSRITADSLALVQTIRNDSTDLAKHISDSTRMVFDTLHTYYATKDTLKNYLTITGLCDSVMKCDGIKALQTADNNLSSRITADSLALVQTIRNDSTDLAKHISDSTRMVFDTLHTYYATKDTLKNYLTIAGLCDSIKNCEAIANLQKADSVLSARLTDTARKIREDFPKVSDKTIILKQGNDTIGRFTLNQEIDHTLTIPTPPDAQVQSDWNQTTTTAKDYIKHKPNIRDSVNRVVLDSLAAANSAINKAIDTIARHNIHDTAMAIRNSIGNGTLTITYGTEEPVTFTANQKTPSSIVIPAPTVPTTVAQLTDASEYLKIEDLCDSIEHNCTNVPLKNADNTFTGANDFTDGTITVPSNENVIPRPSTASSATCDNNRAVAVCDLLAVFDSLSNRIKKLEDELASFKTGIPVFVSLTFSEVTINSMKATAQFTNPGAPIISYQFCISKNEDMSNPIGCYPSTTPEYLFEGLDPKTLYYVSVTATNMAGTSEPGKDSERTLANITVTLTGPESVTYTCGTTETEPHYTVTVKDGEEDVTSQCSFVWKVNNVKVDSSANSFFDTSYVKEVTEVTEEDITVTCTAILPTDTLKRTDTVTTHVTNKPYNYPVISICVSDLIITDKGSQYIDSVKWSANDASFTPVTELNHIYSEVGTYKITVKNATGCDADTTITFAPLAPCAVGDHPAQTSEVLAAAGIDNSTNGLETIEGGSVTKVQDYDHNEYAVVQIGTQCWMAENLRTTHYGDGTEITVGSSASAETPYIYYPNGEATNLNEYGFLYNWQAATYAQTTTMAPSGIQGVCPAGWHIPSEGEWQILDLEVNGSAFDFNNDYHLGGNFTGKLAKGCSWQTSTKILAPGNFTDEQRNSTGFGAVPAGWFNSDYTSFGTSAAFWTCSYHSNDVNKIYTRHINYDTSAMNRPSDDQYLNQHAYAVRCVRDADYNPVMATVTANKNDLTICSNASDTVTYTAKVTRYNKDFSSEYTYEWSVGGATFVANNNICKVTYTSAGDYTVSCKVKQGSDSVAGTSVITTVIVKQAPIFTTCENENNENTHNYLVKLMSLNQDATLDWGDSSDPIYVDVDTNLNPLRFVIKGAPITHLYDSEGSKTITATSNSNGCTTSKQIALGNSTVHPCVLPNAHPAQTDRSSEGKEVVDGSGNLVYVQDYDGNKYPVVQIGSQCWIAENIRTTHYSNGDAIENGIGHNGSLTQGYYYPANSGNPQESYGNYYNWYATTRGIQVSVDNPIIPGVCPTGWHVPSGSEWVALLTTTHATDSAVKLAKSCDWTEGNVSNLPGDYNSLERNAYGFGALPADWYLFNDVIHNYNNGHYDNNKSRACFWSSSTDDIHDARYLILTSADPHIDVSSNDYDNRVKGMSVRCVRNETSELPIPTLMSIDVSGNMSLCGGTTTVTYTAVVNANGTNIADNTCTYQWSITGNSGNIQQTSSSQENPFTVTYTGTGSYTVACTVTTPAPSSKVLHRQSDTGIESGVMPVDFTITKPGATGTEVTITFDGTNQSHAEYIDWGDGNQQDVHLNYSNTISHTYVSGNGDYEITAMRGSPGRYCTISHPVTIVAPVLSITPSPENVSICSNSEAVSYTAQMMDGSSDATNNFNYSWSVTPTSGRTLSSSTGTTVTVTYSAGNTYTVSCTATPKVGSGNLAISTNTAVADNTPLFTVSSKVGRKVTLTLSNSQNVNTIDWGDGDFTSDITSATVSHTYASNSTGDGYTITATNTTANCAKSENVPVSLSLGITPTGNTGICTGGSTSITYTAEVNDNGTTPASGYTYQWSVDPTTDAVISGTGATVTVTYSAVNTYTVSCTAHATAETGDASHSVQTAISALPTPDFTVSGASTGIVTLTGTYINQVNWGDGTTNNQTSHAYSATDNYNITVTNTNGCSKTEENVAVTVPAPVPSLIIGKDDASTSICGDGSTTITYTATLANATASSYSWSVEPSIGVSPSSGDGAANTFEFTFSAPGTYTVHCTANTTADDVEAEEEMTITALATPEFTVSGASTGTVTLTETNNISEVNWGDGTTNNQTSHTYSASGSYTITASNTNGCSKTEANVAVTVPSSGGFVCGTSTVTDFEGHVYHTVQIGTQCWLKENMRATKYSNGDTVGARQTTNKSYSEGYYYYPYFHPDSALKYGLYYNWCAAMKISGNSAQSTDYENAQGICPTGWHVPTNDEYLTLERFISQDNFSYNIGSDYYGNFAGKLTDGDWSKSGVTQNTTDPKPGNHSYSARNSFGLSILPAGGLVVTNAYTAEKCHIGLKTCFWTSSNTSGIYNKIYHQLNYQETRFNINKGDTRFAIPVRCIRDPQTSGGGGGQETPTIDRKVSCVLAGTNNNIVTSTSNDSINISKYSNNNVIEKGRDLGNGIVVLDSVSDYEGHWYTVVQIGTQCWLRENMRATKYSDNQHASVNYYYPNGDNSNSNVKTYGLLYDCATATNDSYTYGNVISTVQGICPSGWHVPSDYEWKNMLKSVNNNVMPTYTTTYPNDYYSVDVRLFVTGDWTNNNGTSCTSGYPCDNNPEYRNKTGFSARPAGFVNPTPWYFGKHAKFWSSWASSQNRHAWSMINDKQGVAVGIFNASNGASVRCVRD